MAYILILFRAFEVDPNQFYDPISENDWKIYIPTLFMRGESSDYVGAIEIAEIGSHFSDDRIETIKQASHWLHAEQPQKFPYTGSDFLR